MPEVQKLPMGLVSESVKYRVHNYEGTIIEMRNFDIKAPMTFAEIADEQATMLKQQKSELARAKAALQRPVHESKLMPDEVALLLEFAQCKDNSVNGDIHEAKSADDLYTFVAPDTRRSVKPHLFQDILKSLIRKQLLSIESTLSSDYIAFTEAGFIAAKEALTNYASANANPTAPPVKQRAATVQAGGPRTAKGPTKKGTVLAMLQSHPTTKEEIAHELAISLPAASSLINDLRRDGHDVQSTREGGYTRYTVGVIPTVQQAGKVGNDDQDDGDASYADRVNDTASVYRAEGMSEEEAMQRALEEEPKHA